LKATYLDESGKEQTMVMGCYGIGVSRTLSASIEQNHDEKGIIWPEGIAPFQVELISLGVDAKVMGAAQKIYDALMTQKVEVLLDDRDERAGVKFNDADLIGIPKQVVIGSRGLEKGEVEVKERRTGEKKTVALDQVFNHLT
jgi:prolyl-tRNA synthetase